MKQSIMADSVKHVNHSMLFKECIAMKPSSLAVKCIKEAINKKLEELMNEYKLKTDHAKHNSLDKENIEMLSNKSKSKHFEMILYRLNIFNF